VAIRSDPFCTGWRGHRQWQLDNSDSLPDFVPAANRHNLTIARQINFLHNTFNAKDTHGQRQSKMLLHHREESDSLFL
jgi:hypothetical protein